jgi:hypothetical protein
VRSSGETKDVLKSPSSELPIQLSASTQISRGSIIVGWPPSLLDKRIRIRTKFEGGEGERPLGAQRIGVIWQSFESFSHDSGRKTACYTQHHNGTVLLPSPSRHVCSSVVPCPICKPIHLLYQSQNSLRSFHYMIQLKNSSGFSVLSIDGSSGFRSLSQIIQLDEYLKTIPEVHDKEGISPRPCEHFDLIVGTSVGGLLAIMFGRLGMSCDEAKDAYIRIGRRMYVEGKTGAPAIRQDGSLREEFREEFMKLLEERGGDVHLKSSQERGCPVSVRFTESSY